MHPNEFINREIIDNFVKKLFKPKYFDTNSGKLYILFSWEIVISNCKVKYVGKAKIK